MGPVNYNWISPVNGHGKGQSTNYKINGGVLQAAKTGRRIAVYAHPTSNLALENAVNAAVRPSGNARQVSESVCPRLEPAACPGVGRAFC